MYDTLIHLLRDERGATAIEYGLIAVLASISIIAGARGIGVKLQTYFPQISAAFP
jgi:Flp pilus assembly pilin Flp